MPTETTSPAPDADDRRERLARLEARRRTPLRADRDGDAPTPSLVPDLLDAADTKLIWDNVRPLIGLAAGANIVMQLARQGVGRGVAESKVDSGRLDLHPVKRARTTFGYVVLSLFGTPDERSWLRAEVNRSHRPVHAEPGDAVQYRAMDPDLQLWVAMCIAKGLLDAFDLRHSGRLRWNPRTGADDSDRPEFDLTPDLAAERDRLVQLTSRIGTTLQMPASMWPADTAAFETTWAEGVATIRFDDVTTAYLRDFLRLKWLGPIGPVLGPSHEFISTGFLSPEFRDGLGLRWNDNRQKRWNQIVGVGRFVDRCTPGPLAQIYPRLMLADARRRFRHAKDFT